MTKTDKTYVPLSRGIVEHLKVLKGMPFTIYAYLLSEADFCGADKGVAKKKIRDIAADLEIDYKTVHNAISKLKGKYIEVKPAKNQHSITRFKILKYKTVEDFKKKEQQPVLPQADTEAPPQASTVALGKQRESTAENSNNNTGLQAPKKLRSKEGKKTNKNLITLPPFIDMETWQAFLDMRKAKGRQCVATEHAKKLIIKDLIEFKEQGEDPNSILEQSIKCSWTGVFTLRNKQLPKPSPPESIDGTERYVPGEGEDEYVSPKPLHLQAKKIWDAVLEVIKERVSEEEFFTWFNETVGYSIISGKLTVSVRDEYTKNWLIEHYFTLIQKATPDRLSGSREWELRVIT